MLATSGEIGRSASTVDPGRDVRAGRRRAQGREQPACLEQGRGEAKGERACVLQCLLHRASHLGQELLRGRGVGVHGDGRELQAGGEPDQMLLHVVVERALDGAALGVISDGETPARRPKCVDLAAQFVELVHRVGLPLPQRHRLLRREHPGLSSARAFTMARHRFVEGQPPSNVPATTVVQGHEPS